MLSVSSKEHASYLSDNTHADCQSCAVVTGSILVQWGFKAKTAAPAFHLEKLHLTVAVLPR